MKFTVGLALLILCVSVQAQTLCRICERQNDRCVSRENRNGRNNEINVIYNNHCRRKTLHWKTVTRCELARAACHLTLMRCSTLSCENVRRILASGGGGCGPPTRPRTTPRPRTTRRTRTTTRRTSTTRRITAPQIPVTRPPRTTTRRTITTRRGTPPRLPREPR